MLDAPRIETHAALSHEKILIMLLHVVILSSLPCDLFHQTHFVHVRLKFKLSVKVEVHRLLLLLENRKNEECLKQDE